MKYVPDKDKKVFAKDLKSIYQASNEEQGHANMEAVTEKWQDKYLNSMKSWKDIWDAISPIFKFSSEVHKVIYTTNAIESLTASLKALYLATFEATKRWITTLRN